ncbi:hypothetical protein [Roseivirga spongicola]|uniref:Uncharacterized protein n=1 Tax=Roseivirga spongicola TaxID=333140 RepID=A0A150X6B7_9BACT|nr:hypothetical protein [Roseivirga spongicola]KYG74226.1 hypothetical protein AWW68_16390 [Roseivirga spongicola]WPZ09108.1 hypothetical protein T7867_12660 [Roseivirga spongicola]
MFGLFKKKPKEPTPPKLLDLNNNPIVEGSVVKSLRYELGECVVELEGLEYFYVSKSSGQRISYTKMVDAITENQKVLLLGSSDGAE